jgi:hypothetical protein
MRAPNPLSFIGRKVLVGVPQRSKVGGSKIEFGGSWECDIVESAPSLIKKFVFEKLFNMKFI